MYLELYKVSTSCQDRELGAHFGKLQGEGIICFFEVYSPDISFFIDSVYFVESVGRIDPESPFDGIGDRTEEPLSATLVEYSDRSLT